MKYLSIYDKKLVLNNFKKKDADKARLKKQCMELWALVVKCRAKWMCEFPGCLNSQLGGNKIDAHHYLTRGAFANLKYVPENGIALCVSHHRFGPDSAHQGNKFREKLLNPVTGLVGRFNSTWEENLEREAQVKTKTDLFITKLYLIQELKPFKDTLPYDIQKKYFK